MAGKVAAACVLAVLAWCVDARPLLGAQAGAGPRGVEAVHVQGKIWMLVTPDGNLALQVGEEGALLVDTGKSGTSDAVKAAIRQVTTQPLRWVINTSAGPTRIGNNAAFGQSAGADVNAARVPGPEIIAREAVLIHMSKSNYPVDAWPTDAYLERERTFRFNGEAIEIVHQPSAYSDGDSIVLFRGSDVIVAGEIYSTRRFPLVDREHGGTVEGALAGLNRILDIAVPAVVVNSFAEGGTLVIPGSGRLSGPGRRHRISRHGAHRRRPDGEPGEDAAQSGAGEGRAHRRGCRGTPWRAGCTAAASVLSCRPRPTRARRTRRARLAAPSRSSQRT